MSADALAPALKPCPFCGGEMLDDAITDRNEGLGKTEWYWIGCPNCGATTESGLGTIEDVVANWNRRAPVAAAAPASSALAPERIAETPMLTNDLLDAIEVVDADCRRFQWGDDRGKPLSSVYEILSCTPEQGTDLPTALKRAMGTSTDVFLLSHERRLLAITLARALPELMQLRADRERLERRVGELESAIKLIVWAFDAAEIADRSDSTPDYVRGIEAAQARLNAAIDAARPVEPPRELSWAEHSLVIARDVPFAGRWYFIGDMAYPYAWTRSVTDARWYETEHVAANDLARGRKADRYAFDGARVEPCPPIIPRATPEPTNG